MKQTKQRLAIVIVVVLVSIGGLWLYASNNSSPAQDTATTTQTAAPAAKLIISDDKKTVSYQGQTGKTALAILQSLTTVATSTSSYGEFVTGINGTAADGTHQFWAFYVNDKLASEGASTYTTTDGEKIEWRIEDVQ